MWKVKVTTGRFTSRKKALVPIVAPRPVWTGLEGRYSVAFVAFRPPPEVKILRENCYIITICRMYWQNFDVVFAIGRTEWKIQYNVESVYKFPIWSSIEENHKKNSLSICPDTYCCAASIAAFKCAKPSNNYHKVTFLTFETCRKLLQRILLYLSLWMNFNLCE